MKKLKLLFLMFFSIVSLSLFSQTQVTVTNASGPNICDGTAMLDTTNVDTTSIFWMGMGAIINQGSYMVTNLCPGTYYVTFTINGTSTAVTFNIGTNPCLGFSAQLSVTQSQDSINCNGTAVCSVNGGTGPFLCNWSSGSNTSYFNCNLICPGPICCTVFDMNGCSVTVCDTITVTPPPVYGDTLVINGNTCMTPMDTVYSVVEFCSLNYNAVDTAYLSYVTFSSNPLDPNMALNWNFIDTLGQNILSLVSIAPVVTTIGCYEVQLTIYCLQKNLNIKTIIVNDARAIFYPWDGIDELSQTNKTIVKITDMIGQECKMESNKLLIIHYSDGTIKKVVMN